MPLGRHGYYLASHDEERGDLDLSAEARSIWYREWSPEETVRVAHEEPVPPGLTDGVSIFVREDGEIVRRLTMHGEVRAVEPFIIPTTRREAWA
jgi:hypothetical protein